jgi:cell division protein FtsQ
MKRYKLQREIGQIRKSKKEKFWSGSGKFFLILIVLYAIILGINEIVGLGQDQMENFKAEIIEINGNKILNLEQIKALCNYNFSDNNKRKIILEEIAESLMKSEYIKGVSVTKRLPRTLNITVEERKPVAFIYGRGLNLIDDEGYLIQVPKIKISWDLPLISGISESLGKLGKKTKSNQALKAVALVSYLQNNDNLMLGLISEINMKHNQYYELIMVKGGAKIKINRIEYEKELYVLQNYIKSYLDWDDLARIDYIDLRFKDQLIVKKKT